LKVSHYLLGVKRNLASNARVHLQGMQLPPNACFCNKVVMSAPRKAGAVD